MNYDKVMQKQERRVTFHHSLGPIPETDTEVKVETQESTTQPPHHWTIVPLSPFTSSSSSELSDRVNELERYQAHLELKNTALTLKNARLERTLTKPYPLPSPPSKFRQLLPYARGVFTGIAIGGLGALSVWLIYSYH